MKVPKPTKLPSGTWHIRLRLGNKDVYINEATAKKATREAERIKVEWLSNKRLPESERDLPTLSEAIDKYIADRQYVLSPCTIRGYRIIQKNRFPSLMGMPVNKITKDAVQQAVNSSARTISPKTISTSWGLVNSVLSDQGINIPAPRLPQKIKKEHPFLQPEEIPIFCEAIRGKAIEIPALLALCSLRQSEILGLRWVDIDLKKGLAHVDGAVVPDENHKYTRKIETKNVSSRRYVPLMPQLIEALELASKGKSPDMPVVTISASWMYKQVNAICKEHGLPLVGMHGLRHSFASLMYHNGVSEKVTMRLGGWSDNATMRNIYTHIAEVDERDAVEDFRSFFTPDSPTFGKTSTKTSTKNKKYSSKAHFLDRT